MKLPFSVILILVFSCLILSTSKMSVTFHCSLCPNTLFQSIQKYLHHLNLNHSHDHQNKFICTIVKGCNKMFSTFQAFKCHIYRKHNELIELNTTNKVCKKSVSCKICQVQFSTTKLLGKHVKEHLSKNETVSCPLNDCEKTFNVYSSFTSHLSRCHNQVENTIQKELDSQGFVQSPPSDGCNDIDEHGCDSPILNTIGQEQITKHISLLMLKFQEIYMLPQSTTQKIFEDLISVQELYTEHTVSTLKTSLSNVNFDNKEEVLSNIFNLLTNGPFQNSFSSLTTPFKRMNYCKKELNYVSPTTILLGNDKFNKPRKFEYIPVLETLKFLLNQSDVLEQVSHPQLKTNNNLFSDYGDGLYCQKHPIFSQDNQSLKVFLYCDEFEVCNPLGVHRKTHKMLAFYYILGNIHPKYRSSTQIIQLAILVKSVDVKQFKLQRIVEPLVRDLNILAREGIEVKGKIFKGGLAFISGDNLGSNMLGGFLESFSQNVYRYCRTCLSSKDEVQTTFTDDSCVMRNADNYKLHVDSIQYDTKNVSLFGVKCNSPFNDVANFHVTEGLPPDISHDLLEGVVPFELGLIIRELLKMYPNQLSLPMINEKIQMWPYGPMDVLDKPAIIPENLNCKQTAAKVWTLIRLFPLIFHCFVSENNKYWLLLLDLKEIVELSFSPNISLEQVAYLKMKINDHLQFFKELFPLKKLRAKQHFLIHYANHILNFGNLKCCWTLRFEAKHHYLKRLASIGNNFKHITHTLAERHQLYQCYCASSGKGYLKYNVIFGTSKPIHILNSSVREREIFNYEKSGTYVSYTFCKINSLHYACGMFLIVGMVDDEPHFSQIKYIVEKEGSVHFVIREYSGTFHSHAGAYVLTAKTKLDLINHQALKYSYPISSYRLGDDRYIVLKYSLASEDV